MKACAAAGPTTTTSASSGGFISPKPPASGGTHSVASAAMSAHHPMQAADQILEAITRTRASLARPVIVALDGGSGSGKSTLAGLVQQEAGAALVQLDDFYTTVVSEAELLRHDVAGRLHDVFEWE